MDKCIFCKIVEGGIPPGKGKVWEDRDFISFLDLNPVEEGHALVIPKKHVDSLVDLDEETSERYIGAIQKVGKILMKRYNADGFNLVLNNGKAAGQVVKHIHFHLLPRKEGDNKRGIFTG